MSERMGHITQAARMIPIDIGSFDLLHTNSTFHRPPFSLFLFFSITHLSLHNGKHCDSAENMGQRHRHVIPIIYKG